jgi:EmrB/QacA subfamily drug resistance transporter
MNKETKTSQGWILAMLMATMMLAAMDSTIVSTAIPQIVDDLGGFSLFTWVFSIYVLAQTVTIPLYGKLADLYGRKPILIFGTIVFLVGSAASASSWNMVSLIVFRAIQGTGAGSIMATVNTLAGDLFSIRKRAKVQGWLSSVWGFSAIVGPVIGGAFAEYATWRWIFLVNLPIGAVAIFLIWRLLHEEFEQEPHQIDYAGSVSVLLTVGLLIFGLLQGGHTWNWISIQSLIIILLVIVLAAITVWIERCAEEPIIPGWLWGRRVLSGSNLAMVGMGIVMMGPIAYLPTFGQSVFGLGAIAAGLLVAVSSIVWPFASSLSGKLYLSIGFRDTAIAGVILMVLASAGFLALPYPGPIWAVVIDQIVLGAGFGLLSTPLLVGIQSVVGWEERGVVTGANMFARYLGQSLGAAIVGAIFNAAILSQFHSAPSSLQSEIPNNINKLISVLHNPALGRAVKSFLRHSIYIATHHIYLGMTVFGVLTLFCVLLAPRRFPIVDDERSGMTE